jgi:hypothetical protein
MRVLACTILTIATMLVAAPVRAQTYDPNYPVCLQTYGRLYRLQFYVAGAVRNVRIGPLGAVPDQSVFCAGRQETAAASRRLLGAAASAYFGRHAQFCPRHRFDV